MPEPNAQRLLAQTALAVKRRGSPVTIRKSQKIAVGSAQLVSPPTLDTPTVNGNIGSGATVLSLNAISAYGTLIAGDQIIVGAQTFTVTANVAARAAGAAVPGFDAIPISAPVGTALAANAAVTMNFVNDVSTPAIVSSFPTSLVANDGDLILNGDLQVVIWADPAVGTPQTGWEILMLGGIRTITMVNPSLAFGVPIKYTMGARA